jgi:hypothetical protein
MGLMEEHKGGSKSGQRNSVPNSKFQAPLTPKPPPLSSQVPKILSKNLH